MNLPAPPGFSTWLVELGDLVFPKVYKGCHSGNHVHPTYSDHIRLQWISTLGNDQLGSVLQDRTLFSRKHLEGDKKRALLEQSTD